LYKKSASFYNVVGIEIPRSISCVFYTTLNRGTYLNVVIQSKNKVFNSCSSKKIL